MSARTTLHTYNRYAHRANSGPIDLAGDFHRSSATPGSRPSRLLQAVLAATVYLAAASSFAAATSGPKPVKSGPLATAPAPTAAHLSGTTISQPIGNGFQQPEQVAVDSSGNLYIADVLTNDVYKETLIDGVYTQTILRANLGGPVGVAVDSKSNVYISDSDNSRVLKETLQADGSYIETTVPTTGLGGIVFDLTVDSKGSIYIADALNNRVVKETATLQGSYTQSVIPATGLFSPEGVAVDSHGSLYIADTFNDRIVKETPSSAGYTQSVIVPAVLPLGPAGVNAPQQIFLVGDTLYIADTLNSRIAKATYDGTTKTYTLSTVATASLNAPTGVALDGNGNLFIADTNNKRVIEQAPGESTDFGSLPVGQTSAKATLTFTFDAGGTIGAPAAGTQFGGSGLFVLAGGTCVKGATFATGKSCTVLLTFTPETVGFAYGTARLTNSSNSTIVTASISGTGTGSKLIYPDNPSDLKIGAALKNSQGVAVDLSGDVYIADTGNHQVLKETPAANSTFAQSFVAKGLHSPSSIAVDKSGDVFITDTGSDSVLEETPGTGGVYTQTVVYAAPAHGDASTIPGPLVLDRAGNLWVAFPGKLQEFSIVSGAWQDGSSILIEGTKTTSHGSSEVAIAPISLAIDQAGNFYVGEAQDTTLETPQRILRYTSTAAGYGILLVESDTYPRTITVDRIGNVFVIDNSNVVHVFVPTNMVQNGHGSSNAGYYLGIKLNTQSQLSGPEGLAVDASDLVYIANTGFSDVLRESWLTTPVESFPQTVLGSTSSAILHSVLNIGNAAANFTVPSTAQNPTVSSPFELNTNESDACPVLTASSNPSALSPGEGCSVSLSFSPPSVANDSGTLTYAVNNGTQAKFSFSLTGKGIATIPDITWPAPASIVYGTALSATQLDATATHNGNTVPGTFTYNPALGTILSGGTHSLNVQFTPSGIGYSNASVSVTISVTPVPLTIVADSFSRLYGSPNPTFTLSYIGFVNGDTQSVLNGAAVISTEATLQFPWGYYPITVTPGNLSSPSYTLTFVDGTLVITQVPLTVTAQDVNVTNSSDIPTPYPCSFTGLVNGDTAAVIGGACATDAQSYSNSPEGIYTVTPTAGTLAALNYTFTTFTSGTLTISESQAKPVKHPLAANHAPASHQAAANLAHLKTTSLAPHKGK